MAPVIRQERETPTNAYSKRSGAKITVSTSFQHNFFTALFFLANSYSTILTPKDNLGWHKLLVTGTKSV